MKKLITVIAFIVTSCCADVGINIGDVAWTYAGGNTYAGSWATSSGFDPASLSPLCWWKFEDGLTDEMGNFDLSTGGGTITYASGLKGKGAYFGGSAFATSASMAANFSTEATFVIWLSRTANPPVAGNRTGFLALSTGSPYTHYPYTDGNVYMKIWLSSRITISNTGLDYRTWNMFTVRTKPGAGGYSIFQNTNKVLNTTGPATVPLTTAIRIGRNEGSDYYKGTLDEGMIFTRWLSDAEIFQLYNWGTP